MTLPPMHSHPDSRLVSGSARRWLVSLSRGLLRPARLFKIFLAGLVLVLGLGLAGGLQGGLGSLGAGETGLAYAVAGMVNGGRLRAVQNDQIYQLNQSADAALQNYFVLNELTGSLRLRDGLKSIDTGSNPLQAFPLSIRKIDQATGLERQGETRNLYVHVVDCPSYLQLSQADRVSVPSEVVSAGKEAKGALPVLTELDAAGQVILCESKKPFFGKISNVGRVYRWINWKVSVVPPGRQAVQLPDKSSPISARIPMLSPHRSLSVSELVDVYGLPPSGVQGASGAAGVSAASGGSSLGDQAMTAYLKQGFSKEQAQAYGAPVPASIGAVPVTEIVLLVDKAEPGMELFRVSQSPRAEARMLAMDRHEDASDWREGIWVLVERGLLLAFVMRVPVLVVLGLALPLLLYLIRYQFVLVRGILKPYLLLLAGQIVTMAVASLVMGEGLVLWVGFIYTLLRVLQLWGALRYLRQLECLRMLHVVRVCGLMQWLANLRYPGMARLVAGRLASSLRIARAGIVRPGWLKPLLGAELVLWFLNALGLFLHFSFVFWRFFDISPA